MVFYWGVLIENLKGTNAKPFHNIDQEEMENNHELKRLISQDKDNIADGEVLTTKEIIDSIQIEDL